MSEVISEKKTFASGIRYTESIKNKVLIIGKKADRGFSKVINKCLEEYLPIKVMMLEHGIGFKKINVGSSSVVNIENDDEKSDLIHIKVSNGKESVSVPLDIDAAKCLTANLLKFVNNTTINL